MIGPAWDNHLRELKADGIAVDLVVFTGDLGDWGHETDYAQGVDFLRRTCEALEVPLERLFVVPGNHDIARKTEEKTWKSLRKRMTSEPPAMSEWMAGGKPPSRLKDAAREAILHRQAAFWNAVTVDLGRTELGPWNHRHKRLGYQARVQLEGLRAPLWLIGLDTSWLAGDEHDTGKLWLTEHQLGHHTTDPEGAELPGFRLALMHHRFADLADGDRARRLLADRVDLLLHGHQHEPMAEPWTSPDHHLLVLAAGCLYEGDAQHRYLNACQLIDVDLTDDSRPVHLTVRFRGWSERNLFWGDDSLLYQNAPGGRLELDRGAQGWHVPRGPSGTSPRDHSRALIASPVAVAIPNTTATSTVGNITAGAGATVQVTAHTNSAPGEATGRADRSAAPEERAQRASEAPTGNWSPLPSRPSPTATNTILFLAASPRGMPRLALDREARCIQEELERSGSGGRFRLEIRLAATPMDLLRELRRLKPTVIHFSGHGGNGGFALEAAKGDAQVVSARALQETFRAAGASVRLAIFNTSDGDMLAESLLPHIDCAIGMSEDFGNEEACIFSIGFYGSLGEGDSVDTAFKQARAALSLHGGRGSAQPRLFVRDCVDASKLVLAANASEQAGSPAAPALTSPLGWPGASLAVPTRPSSGTQTERHDVPMHASAPSAAIDLLIVTALTEEAQVVSAVMELVATRTGEHGELTFYDFPIGDGRVARVATASAHSQGATSMGVFVAPLLSVANKPRSASLVGIAATVDPGQASLGDVPFAEGVVSYDDIAIQDSTLTFRTDGFPVDSKMRRAVGALRTSVEKYQPWQHACTKLIAQVIESVNLLRKVRALPPESVAPPHILVDKVASGPFLLRDADFREALRTPAREKDLSGTKIAAPVHPKLVSTEMESHGFMRAAHDHGVPATVIKGISDEGDNAKRELEKKSGGFYRTFACSNATLAALHILREALRREVPASNP